MHCCVSIHCYLYVKVYINVSSTIPSFFHFFYLNKTNKQTSVIKHNNRCSTTYFSKIKFGTQFTRIVKVTRMKSQFIILLYVEIVGVFVCFCISSNFEPHKNIHNCFARLFFRVKFYKHQKYNNFTYEEFHC